MFDSVRSSKRVVQVILLLIILPFAFWGVESYMGWIGTSDSVARVGDTKISPAEFTRTLHEQQDRLRAAMGREFSPAMLDNPEARRAMLDSIINQRLLALKTFEAKLAVTDEQLREFIAAIPALQVDGQFSRQRYEEVLRSQGMNQTAFEQRLRQDLAMQQIASAVGDAAFATRAEADKWLALQMEVREVSEAIVQPEHFAAQVKPTEDSLKQYYETNRKLFEIPEQVRAEYVVLSQAGLADQVSIAEDEIKSWYDSHSNAYRQPEERRASHILILSAKDAPADQVRQSRAKAEEILKQVRQAPAEFANLAKQHSQDEGSATKGGDLGYFTRGAMVKPFEDAVFGMKENEVSDLVQSEFGFHIIKITGIKPETGRKLDEVRAEIIAELKKQAAGRKMAEVAEIFSNTVYEQADSLKPAAEKLGLAVRQSDWIAKGKPPSQDEWANERLIAALFSDDAIKAKRNTEAVEVSPSTLVSARVLEHKPASLPAFETVRSEIERRLVREEASRLAQKEGAEKLGRLNRGEPVEIAWSQPRPVRRSADPNMSAAALKVIFKAPAGELPAYAGAELPGGGYGIYKIISVKRAEAAQDQRVSEGIRQQITRMAADDELNAYLAALRLRYPVEINQRALETKDR